MATRSANLSDRNRSAAGTQNCTTSHCCSACRQSGGAQERSPDLLSLECFLVFVCSCSLWFWGPVGLLGPLQELREGAEGVQPGTPLPATLREAFPPNTPESSAAQQHGSAAGQRFAISKFPCQTHLAVAAAARTSLPSSAQLIEPLQPRGWCETRGVRASEPARATHGQGAWSYSVFGSQFSLLRVFFEGGKKGKMRFRA